jgi:hypothetical protein
VQQCAQQTAFTRSPRRHGSPHNRRARQSQLEEADAFEIRKRAERWLGEMMEAEEKAQGARVPGVGKRGLPPNPRSLAAQGVDKNLADRARRAAAMPLDEFEEMIRRGREQIYRSAERAATLNQKRHLGREQRSGFLKTRFL